MFELYAMTIFGE